MPLNSFSYEAFPCFCLQFGVEEFYLFLFKSLKLVFYFSFEVVFLFFSFAQFLSFYSDVNTNLAVDLRMILFDSSDMSQFFVSS